MKTFICKTCNQKFEAEGIRVDWNDPTFGPCNKYVAKCPCNGEDCDEYRPVKNSKSESMASSPSCGAGCCGCGR